MFKMTTLMRIPQELYFNNMSEFLNIKDFINILLVNQKIKIYDTDSNWMTLLHSKYPEYHKIIIKNKNININKKIIQELMYILYIYYSYLIIN